MLIFKQDYNSTGNMHFPLKMNTVSNNTLAKILQIQLKFQALKKADRYRQL